MGLWWVAVLGCICGLVTSGCAAAVPADTLVITKPDNNADPVAPSTDLTTEEPLAPIKILEMNVESDIALRYSRTFVATKVKNAAKRSQEATFSILLPESAFISGFVMTIDGKSYKAYVKEKEEAKQIYTDAVSQGFGAAHIATKARDSNHFTVSVNVEPQSIAIFNLTYEELLERRNGVYQHAINLHPGSLVPNLNVVVHIKEAQKITILRVPEISTGNEIVSTEGDSHNTKAVIEKSGDDRKATITFKPDLEEQKRLEEIYVQKSKESRESAPSWPPSDENQKSEGTLGQFVVQYDVDRSAGNEVLVNDGYFVHFFAPTGLPPLKKYVVFVLDTSGSMGGRKIIQLREAMTTILEQLHQGDYFSIVEFDSSVKVHDLKEADGEEPTTPRYYYFRQPEVPPVLLPPSQATSDNIAKAKIIINRLNADGGTNIAGALDVAIELIKKGVKWEREVIAKPLEVKEKDNKTSLEKEESTNVENNVEKETKEVEKKTDKEEPEPMIIFLTDGEPTIGETMPSRITSQVTEKNSGRNKAVIYSLAFGEYADRKFLRSLSLRNNGFMRHIYEAADAALQLREFYKQITSPLLGDVKFNYPPQQIEEESLTKNKFRTFYLGSEMVVAGRLLPTTTEITPLVHGYCGIDEGFARIPYEIRPIIPVPEKKRDEYLPLERLWAYLTIKQLLDERDAADDLDKKAEEKNRIEKKALDLALKYSFVTELTSLVVVKPNDTKAVDAESVDKQPGGNIGSFGYGSSAPGGGLGGLSFSAPALLAAPAYPMAASFAARPAVFRPLSIDRGYPALPGQPGIPGPPSPPGTGFGGAFGQPSGNIFGYITTPAPFPPVFATEKPNPLEPYHLEQFPWAEPLLDASNDELVIKVNETDIHLKLSKDLELAKTFGEVGCDHATDGAAGLCVYLTRCDAAQTISADLYSSTYCLVDNQYAGVCCPRATSETTSNKEVST